MKRSVALCGTVLFSLAVHAAGPHHSLNNKNFGPKIGQGKPAPKDLRYEFFEIPVGGYAYALDINNKGEVGGQYFSSETGELGTFLFAKGEVQLIRKPGVPHTVVALLNDSGLMGGNWGTDTAQTAGFYDRKTQTFLALDPPYPGRSIHELWRIDDRGQATGTSCNGNWFYGPRTECISWLYTRDGFETLKLIPPDPVPTGLNNQMQIAGIYY